MELRLGQFEPRAESRKQQPFVSHSRRDLEKVHPIRNELERRGHNPLLFFLKCLKDDAAAVCPNPSAWKSKHTKSWFFAIARTRRSRQRNSSFQAEAHFAFTICDSGTTSTFLVSG